MSLEGIQTNLEPDANYGPVMRELVVLGLIDSKVLPTIFVSKILHSGAKQA